MAKHSRRRRQAAVHLDTLESRTLLSGVTIITHGAEFFGSGRPGWIDAMATAIRNREGASTAIYALRLEPDGSGGIKETSFSRLAGPSPTSANSTTDETVLLLDWAAASNVDLLSLRPDYSTQLVAAAALPYLTHAFPGIGLAAPLVEGAIQLIGHSRGGSLISVLATDLGQMGIWVDQVTTLDPVPVPPDPFVSLKTNTIFADNYYETNSLTPGSPIAGAVNVGPLKLGGAYGILDGGTHGDVHLFYQGTINLAASVSDGSKNVQVSWYPGNGLNRATTGFYYSRLVGGTRPAKGIGTPFGGAGARASVTHAGAQWANLTMVTTSSSIVAPGGAFNAKFRYGSFNAGATISWYLDPDTNPYNGNSVLLASENVNATGDAAPAGAEALIANAATGNYYLEGQIVGAAGTRYAYSPRFTVGNPPPIGSLDPANATTVSGWALDPDTKATSITTELFVDGTLQSSMTANISRQDVLTKYGTATHGFSFDLTTLPLGPHRIDVYALDATTIAPTLLASRMVNTNQAPIGHIDAFTKSALVGWALDPNAGAAPIQVAYSIDGNAAVVVMASAPNADLNGKYNPNTHGFNVALPQMKAGAHTVNVYAIDSTTDARTLIGTKTITVANPAGNLLPKGTFESVTATTATGWVVDPTRSKLAIKVRVDVDGVAGTPVLANIVRKDLTAKLGSANHGFSVPLTLTPGEHRIDVYALDGTTQLPVWIGSRVVTAPKAVTSGHLDTVTQASLIGWAYSAASDAGTGGTPIIRIQIDNVAEPVFTTTLLRADVNTNLSVSGNYGFSISTPALLAGTHSVVLVMIDPLTLGATTLQTVQLVTT